MCLHFLKEDAEIVTPIPNGLTLPTDKSTTDDDR